jgi:hypothetical protein
VVSPAGIHTVNAQNNRYWSSQNAYLTHEVLLHPVKVDVWCAASARRIVAPVVFITKRLIVKDIYRSFSGNYFRSYQKNKDSKASFIKTQLLPTLHLCVCRLCPMSSGTELSAVVFGQHVHSILILVILFLRGCLEGQVYNSNSRMEELKNICREIGNIHG